MISRAAIVQIGRRCFAAYGRHGHGAPRACPNSNAVCSKTGMRQRYPFWATVLTIISVCILCALGVWQLGRLHWKTALLAHMAVEAARPAVPVSVDQLEETWDMRRGKVQGVFDHAHEMALAPRTYDGQTGYHILTPLITKGGSVMIVNRGWVPLDKKDQKARPESLIAGSVSITGTFRKPQPDNIFVPMNRPQDGAWYRMDLADMARYLGGQKLPSVVLYADPDGNNASRLPIAAATTPQIANNHLQYAIFWFAMAVVLVGVYIARFVRRAT